MIGGRKKRLRLQASIMALLVRLSSSPATRRRNSSLPFLRDSALASYPPRLALRVVTETEKAKLPQSYPLQTARSALIMPRSDTDQLVQQREKPSWQSPV